MLKGKNIFITGTNRGIGKAILEACAAVGANCWAHARANRLVGKLSGWEVEKWGDGEVLFSDWCKGLAEKYGVSVTPVFFDMTDASTMKDAVRQLMTSKVAVDVLVNNAGITDNALFQMSSEKMLRTEFEVNVFAPFMLTQYILKIMLRQKHGNIVNIASVSGLRGDIGRSVYGMTKAALVSLTQSLAAEVGRQGVRVNAVAPGFIETDMMAYMTPEVIQRNLEMSRLGRIGKAEEVARIVVFLASDEAAYMTGQVVRVDGGMGV
jgi:3-oxoacyl-[acyl-carrier protein] reductase